MAGPADIEQFGPRNEAVVSFAPRFERSQAPQREPFYTTAGGKTYDVHDPTGATDYLTEIHNIDLPNIRGMLDATTGYFLASATQKEKRAAIYEDGSHENVAEHSHSLTVIAYWIALTERKELDRGKVGFFAAYHDLMVEAFGKDTPIHDEEALATKDPREAAGLTLFLDIVGIDSELGMWALEYEHGRSPEARFIRALDKVVAYQHSLDNKAILHRIRNEDFEDVVNTALPKAVIDETAFEKMKMVMKELGRKWIGWGCKPFKGDPNEIVENIAKWVQDQGAEIIRIKEPQMELAPDEPQLAEIKRFPLKGIVEAPLDRPIRDTETLRALGVKVLGRGYYAPVESQPPSPIVA